MEKTKKLILGAGISGLFIADSLKECMVVERNSSPALDFLDNTFPKYLHSSEYLNERFKGCRQKKFKIHIFYNEKFFNFFDPCSLQQDIYESYCLKKYGKIVLNKMNGYLSKTYSKYYIEDKKDIVADLFFENIHKLLMHTNIDKIDLKKRIVQCHSHFDDDIKIKYETLINTLPIKVFNDLCGIKCEYDQKFFYLLDVDLKKEYIFDQFDFCYVADKNYNFHRINYDNDKHRLVFELDKNSFDFTHAFEFLSRFNIGYEDIKTYSFYDRNFFVPKDNLHEKNLKNVYMIGRFAQSNYQIKVEDVIRDARRML